MSNNWQSIKQSLISFIGLVIFLALFIIGLFVFSYIIIIAAIIGLVLFSIAYIRAKMLHSRARKHHDKQPSGGRTIEHDK